MTQFTLYKCDMYLFIDVCVWTHQGSGLRPRLEPKGTTGGEGGVLKDKEHGGGASARARDSWPMMMPDI